ncbi:MAG: phosphoketolase family protein [Candidatus Pacebacteria bacterium]|nr:phosphoketolase family protein [Candidatus Paceibacterota bacterium]
MSEIKNEAKALTKLNRLTNYLSTAQIFLKDNFLLERALLGDDIKNRLLGHWGTCPGINFVQGQTNRLIIKNKDRDFLFVVGPGHGFPAYQSNIFIDGSLSNFFPDKIPYSKKGFEEIIKNFSTPYGYPSHLNPEAPGVLLEGGELGYSLSVSAGAVLDNPNLITVCLVGDGEAETGPLSASWNLNKFLSPKSDGVVLPILHLNGYKISGPTIFGRMKDADTKKYFEALGYKVYFIDEGKKKDIQIRGIEIFDKAIERIKKIQKKARKGERVLKPEWPLIILKSPKGMSGVETVDGKKVKGNYLSHQVVFDDVANNEEYLKQLEEWLQSYKISELISFDEEENIVLDKDIQKLIPEKERTLGYGKYAHGGNPEISLPNLEDFLSEKNFKIQNPIKKENSMFFAGKYLSEVLEKNDNLRIFSPDETYSNRIQEIFKSTKRAWQLPIKSFDEDLAGEGKVIEILSEHLLFGMLWGYVLSGRFGYFVSYEAFAQIIASMADQYVKFLHASKNVHFRKDVPSLNIILSSLLERQDHNGYSHQNPSLIANNLDRDSDLVNIYFPADRNMMIYAMEKTLKTKNQLNIIVAGKKMSRVWLDKEESKELAENEIGIFNFISDQNPDLVVATAGDYITEEAIVGVKLFKEKFPNIKVRFVNFFKIDILSEKNHKISSEDILENYLTKNKGIVFNYHGYTSSIKKLLFDYDIADRIIVNGYEEEGSTTSPFDMKARNGLSRFNLVADLSTLAYNQNLIKEEEFKNITKEMANILVEEKEYIIKNKVDPDWIKKWEI